MDNGNALLKLGSYKTFKYIICEYQHANNILILHVFTAVKMLMQIKSIFKKYLKDSSCRIILSHVHDA